ncbi:MAG: ROK family transcriptional regulator [Saccharofermentanales bacterium]|jgi:N-acetylglucosamine repressor
MKIPVVRHQENLKYNNLQAVLKVIQRTPKETISRADIAKLLNMSPTSISRLVTDLIDIGLVVQDSLITKGVGRSAINLKINDQSFYALGIAIDCNYINLSIIDLNYKIIAEKNELLNCEGLSPEEIIDKTFVGYEELCSNQNISQDKILAVGISCSGLIDYKNGIVKFSPQFNWHNVPLAEIVKQKYNLPSYLDNDVKMALIGATFQSNQLVNSDVTYLTIGAGVAAAIMYDGVLVRGTNNASGEIGHSLFSLNGKKCSCGKKGCISPYISEYGLKQEAKNRYNRDIDITEIIGLYRQDDPIAHKLIDELTDNIVIVINNLVYTYNTKYILLGGSLFINCPEIFEISKIKFDEYDYKTFGIKPILKIREYVNNEALGAAYTAQNNMIKELLWQG